MGEQGKLEDQNLAAPPKQTSIILPIRQKVCPDGFFQKSYDFPTNSPRLGAGESRAALLLGGFRPVLRWRRGLGS